MDSLDRYDVLLKYYAGVLNKRTKTQFRKWWKKYEKRIEAMNESKAQEEKEILKILEQNDRNISQTYRGTGSDVGCDREQNNDDGYELFIM